MVLVSNKTKILKIKANENIFLDNTFLEKQNVAFVFMNGGLGDYINFMSSILWIAEANNHVQGILLVREPFKSVAKFILKSYPQFKVWDLTEIKNLPDRTLVCYPKDQLITAVGAHLMDLGFMYYAQMSKPPEGYGYLPEINYKGRDFDLPQNFAVFTPGATARARVMYGKYFNELVNYTMSKGITPVFLGKKDFAHNTTAEGYKASFENDYDLTKGLDLTEKTTLLEATNIMSKALFVLGIDNGLLHFAGTTEVPIIFGHTVASVEHRDIRRKQGLTININIDRKDLSCISCQSNMRFLRGHKFSSCLYSKDVKKAYSCLDLLFSKECATWKNAIDYILNLSRSKSRINNCSMSEIG